MDPSEFGTNIVAVKVTVNRLSESFNVVRAAAIISL